MFKLLKSIIAFYVAIPNVEINIMESSPAPYKTGVHIRVVEWKKDSIGKDFCDAVFEATYTLSTNDSLSSGEIVEVLRSYRDSLGK